jgi:hypothetical protein
MAFHGYISLGTPSPRAYLYHTEWYNRDVGYEAYKAHRRGPTPLEAAHLSEPTRLGITTVQRAAFQTIASM